MTTLADKAILSGADNRPPMLEKNMYDSWKSRMGLYMLNRQHGRMILESVENEAIQPDCDIKATNIILQGLPPEKGDDLIDAINHMMSFFTAVVTSRYPTTNNQLRNSSNPKQQATINNGRVTLQPIQGRQTSFSTGISRTYTPGASGSNSGKQRIVTCYNCIGEGHMSKRCTKPKRKRDDSWFKEKVLLSKVRNSRNKPVVSKVSANTSSSTMACPSEMAALTDAVNVVLRHVKTSPPETIKAIS
ncbi:putative reverse transcriptase domain-containing protein [Tanacetum coccineum]